VVEFIDGRRLGPAFRFLHEHRTEDENGKLIGYRGLDRIHNQLAPIQLRRTRQEVLKDLPKRTDQILHVALTPQQAEPYWEQNDILAALMRKWERQGTAGLALGNRPEAGPVLSAEYADALQLHLSFRQADESFAKTRRVSRNRP
jgi:hypothetical protein